MSRIAVLAAFITTFAVHATVAQQPTQKNIPTIAKATNGIVVLVVTSDKSGQPVAQGTGFLVSKDGRIVTNYHVIKDAASAIVKLPDGAFYGVDGVVAFDEARDLAIIKAHGQNFRVATLGDSDQVQVGEEIVAIGSPLSLESTVSSGIVSGIRTINEEGGKFLQITAPISPGSSGGPLFNMAGEVIGITTLFLKGGENLNFAIPINDAKILLSADSRLRDFPGETPKRQAIEPQKTVEGKKVSEILGWIQTHFQRIPIRLPDGSFVDFDYQLSFDGCQIVLNWISYGIVTIGPFDLADLSAEPHVAPVNGPFKLTLYSVKPLPTSGAAEGSDNHGFTLLFPTEEMAKRQGNAWHDAIVLCGGKKIQDDLY